MRKCLRLFFLSVAVLLALLPAAAASDHDSKLVALTFDDGPCQYTERLLDGLAERGVKATFFVQGVKAEAYSDTIRRMIAEGHQVGNHSYDHPNLSEIPLNEAVAQLDRTNAVLNEITGGNEDYIYRAPYGSSTAALRKEMNAPFFKWSVDTVDWSVKHAWTIWNTMTDQIHDGAIVLAHDTVYQTTDAVLWAIDDLQANGYEFVTINELYRRRGLDAEHGCDDQYDCLPNGTLEPALERPVVQTEVLYEKALVSAECESDVPIYYTIDGTPVMLNAKRYTGPFAVTLPCTIRMVAATDLNGSRSEETVISLVEETAHLVQKSEISAKSYLTRGLLAQMLYEMEEEHCVQACGLFDDVPVSHPYAEAIAWAYASGLFDGTEAGCFEPDRRISREEVAKVLASMLDLETGTETLDYSDQHQISEWAYDSVCAVSACGLMHGCSDGSFCPQNVMTGYEIEIILNRLAEMDL